MTTLDPLNIPKFWKDFPHQRAALLHWWNATPKEVQEEFIRLWRQPIDPIAPLTVVGWQRTSPDFRQKLGQIAERLQIQPVWLAAVISFETGGTFSPSIRNMAGSGATGLIQFMPTTARMLGTTTDKLAAMDATTQLDWVERYFQQWQGRMGSLHDVYMAVLWPAAIGQGPSFILFRHPSIYYRQNAGLDFDKDGRITAGEASRKVQERISRAG